MPKHNSFVFIKLDGVFDLLGACLDSIGFYIDLFDGSFPNTYERLKNGKFSLGKLLVGMFWVIRINTSVSSLSAILQVLMHFIPENLIYLKQIIEIGFSPIAP